MTPPRATYRLQFRDGMDFDRAAALVPYLQKLGVSHLYASPIFKAPQGSTHGYDVADHNEIDESLGGRAGFERLGAALRRAGMGLVLDIVPNHMAASLENPWWGSVVEWGADSPFAGHFDIDWRERLTLPILGRPFEEALAAGELSLALDPRAGKLALAASGQSLPLHPATYGAVLSRAGDPLAAALLAAADAAAPASAAAMHSRICDLLADDNATAGLRQELDRLSADASLVAAVHDLQPWRLLFWKEARRHLSYRRFFEVTSLVGVRVEEPGVFDDVHRLILDLVRAGQVQGLRVDHVDGLADPQEYLTRLRGAVGPEVFLVVEKILGEDETLPPDWPVEGTTGYEFIAAMPDLFVDEAGLTALRAGYDRLLGRPFDVEAERRAAKTAMVTKNFETELTGLVRIASKGGEAAHAPDALREAITALVVAFPVYRTYGDREGMPERDRVLLVRIAAQARWMLVAKSALALDFVLSLLTGDVPAAIQAGAGEFRIRFQQLTGPATAKSVEDTLFYRANALIALDEVGGDPARPVGSVRRFHAAMRERLGAQPHGLTATATHDTKRGEDSRARLYALSDDPQAWCEGVTRWRAMHEDFVRALPAGPAPEPAVEWLLFQALAGAWPEGLDPSDAAGLADLGGRLKPYVEKALREAKLRTDWSEPDTAYEAAVRAYAARLTAPDNKSFLQDFAATLAPFRAAGWHNSLVQTLLKLTVPGVPDIYGGTEGWDFSLVDPDNRRRVDFQALAGQLERLRPGEQGESSKLSLIAAVLALRREAPDLFARGRYVPLQTSGEKTEGLVAFVREHGNARVLALAMRSHPQREPAAGEAWVHLPTGGAAWECVETGARFSAQASRLPGHRVLASRPAALLRQLRD